ncbi:MAG: glycosyltransferase family 2 protein [Pirellulales bacterium]|nr:glycosyltransferase family 2 protein [Pirellulales bacterium]
MNRARTSTPAGPSTGGRIWRQGQTLLKLWRPAPAQLAPVPPANWLPPTAGERQSLAERCRALTAAPRVLCLILADDAPASEVSRTVRSLTAVIYSNWSAIVVGRDSTTMTMTPLPGRLSVVESYTLHKSDGAAEVNALVARHDAEYVLFVEAGDCLAPETLVAFAEHVEENHKADLVYGDEDQLDAAGVLSHPFHKPDWSPALLLSQPYTVYPAFYRRPLLVEAGGLREGWGHARLYDLALRYTEVAETISHLPSVLYHRRAESHYVPDVSGDRPRRSVWGAAWLATRRGASARRRAVEAALERRRVVARVTFGRSAHTQVVSPVPQRLERVSIIMPTRDGGDHLKVAVESVLRRTTYPNYELVLVDNGSTEPATRQMLQQFAAHDRMRVLHDPQPYNFSAINNAAIRQTSSHYILLLNDDTQVISPGWLTDMVGWLEQPGVGAVGAKLLYTDGTIQHAGVALGIGGIASHPHKRFSRRDVGYHGLLTSVRECSAVTGACLLTRRDLFWQVGGLEESLPRAYNDVDFCLRLGERGHRIVFTPTAELYHHESVSRGRDTRDDLQFQQAIAWMQRRWGRLLAEDPYYHPQLSLRSTNFALRQAA